MLQVVDRDGKTHGPFKNKEEVRNYIATRWPDQEQDDESEDRPATFDVVVAD